MSEHAVGFDKGYGEAAGPRDAEIRKLDAQLAAMSALLREAHEAVAYYEKFKPDACGDLRGRIEALTTNPSTPHAELVVAAVKLAEATNDKEYAAYADAAIGRSHSAEEFAASYLAYKSALQAYRAALDALEAKQPEASPDDAVRVWRCGDLAVVVSNGGQFWSKYKYGRWGKPHGDDGKWPEGWQRLHGPEALAVYWDWKASQ